MPNKDKLKAIIDDYKKGKITYEDTERLLRFLTFDEDKEYYENAEKVREKSHIGSAYNPQDLYIEKLRNAGISDIIEGLLKYKVITKTQHRILWLYCVEEETHASIAKKLGVSRQYITQSISRITEKCKVYIEGNYNGDIKELWDSIYAKAITTIPRAKRKDMGYAKHKIAYPTEYLMKISITGKFYKEKYRLRTKCVVPEYFAECFGDDETQCTLCGDDWGGTTCSRRN